MTQTEVPGWEGECLQMVMEVLEALGTDMKGCPPMMYPEAILATIARQVKAEREACAKLADERFEAMEFAMEGEGEPEFGQFETAAVNCRKIAADIRARAKP